MPLLGGLAIYCGTAVSIMFSLDGQPRGQIFGILAGATVAWAVRTVLPSVPATLSYLWIALGVAISIGVGLFFGYYPANRAANLDPIVCLRYE